MTNNIKPVTGAAIYEAGYDEGRACVWMTVKADENCKEDMYFVIQTCRNILSAQLAAEKWQKKENKSVLKHFPHPDHKHQTIQ